MPRGRPKKAVVEKKAPVVRMTAVRYVSDKYGEKGLRALRAMGPEFARELQDEIQTGRRRDELVARKEKAERALTEVVKKLQGMNFSALEGDSCLPRLEKIISSLPDIVVKIKEEKPAVEPSIPEDAIEVSAQA